LEAWHDPAPLRHHDLELLECASCLATDERDHASSVLPDGRDLTTMVLNGTVPRDDEPPALGDLRDPQLVLRVHSGDGARRSLSLVDGRGGIAWVGDVRTRP